MRSPCLSESRTLRYGVFFLLYVRQGIPAGFASTAFANSLTARGVDAETVGAFVAWTGLPWTLQFVWGPVVDRFQGSSMGRRRPWVLGAQVLGLFATLPLIVIHDPVAQLRTIAWIFLVHSVIASIQDTGVDAMAISVVPDHERGRVNAFMRGGFIVGVGAGALLSLAMATRGFAFAAALQSLSLGLLALLTFVVREHPGDAFLPGGRRSGLSTHGVASGPTVDRSVLAIIAELWGGLLAPASLRLFAAIATSYLCASVFIRALSINLIRDQGWGDSELSVFSGSIGTIAALGVVAVGGWLSDRVGHRRLLIRVMLSLGVFLVLFAGLGPWWSSRALTRPSLMLWSMFDPMLSVAAMPALMSLCRRGVEGSQFTAYMALVNLCDVLGSYLAGRALALTSAPVIAASCGLVVLVAVASIRWRSAESVEGIGKVAPAAPDGDDTPGSPSLTG
ncbi:MAG: hypothetical protein NVSMB9_30740 [Isosphaeraceae bacterium]